jgi:hypothetical protein
MLYIEEIMILIYLYLLVVIGTGCLVSCKSNYHTITFSLRIIEAMTLADARQYICFTVTTINVQKITVSFGGFQTHVSKKT